MSWSQVLAFGLLSVVFIAVPGPSVLFTVGRALTLGRREALFSVAGNAIGVYLQVIAVAFGIGVVVGLANPKTIVFFLVGLPQFIDPAAGHAPLQMLVLGAVFPVLALMLDSVWALAAATARAWFARSPRRMELVGGAGGLMMIGLGASIAVTGRKD